MTSPWDPERIVAAMMAALCCGVAGLVLRVARHEFTRIRAACAQRLVIETPVTRAARVGLLAVQFDAYRALCIAMTGMTLASLVAVGWPDLFLTPGPDRVIFIGEFYWAIAVVAIGYYCAMRQAERRGQHPLQRVAAGPGG